MTLYKAPMKYNHYFIAAALTAVKRILRCFARNAAHLALFRSAGDPPHVPSREWGIRWWCFHFKGLNSVFSLRLEDITGAFTVEPVLATGSTSVNIRVTNGSLDYENPNQRKFIILVSQLKTFTSLAFLN